MTLRHPVRIYLMHYTWFSVHYTWFPVHEEVSQLRIYPDHYV